MIKYKSIFKNNQKVYIYFLVIFFVVSNHSLAQQISKALDSIHQLHEDDYSNIHLYDSLFDVYKREKSYSQLGSDAHQLAKWLSREGQLDKTIEILKTGIEARKIANPYDAELLKRSYGNLGNYYKLNKEYTKAIDTYFKMLAVKGSDIFHDLIYIRIGNLYARLKDYYKAIEYYKKAYALYDYTTSRKKLLSYNLKIVEFYKELGYLDPYFITIKNHLIKADSLNKISKNKSIHKTIQIKTHFASIYIGGINQDLEKAKSYYEEIIALAKKIDTNTSNYYYSLCYYNLGMVYANMESYEVAQEYFEKSLEYRRNNIKAKCYPYIGLALIEEKRKNFYLAQEFYDKALNSTLGDKQNTRTLDSIADKDLLATKNISDVLQVFYWRAKAWIAESEYNKDQIDYNGLFKTLEKNELLVDSIIAKDFSFQTKLYARDLESEINILGLEASYQIGNLKKAFYLMEKNKAILLMQDIEEQKTALPSSIEIEKVGRINKVDSLNNSLLLALGTVKDSLKMNIDKEKLALKRYIDSIRTVYPNYSNIKKMPRILDLEDVKIGDDELVIQYTMAETSARETPYAYVMMLSNNNQKLFKLKDVDLLLQHVRDLRVLLHKPFKTNNDVFEYKYLAHSIFLQIFPEKIRDVLFDKKVKIIPDHVLNILPFEALISDIETNKYLIEDIEINYSYSLSFLRENEGVHRKTKQDFFGIAPVNFKNDLVPLKNSDKELSNANRFYRGDVLVKEAATKENFIEEAAKYRILHLATHADAKNTDSIQPWIALYDKKITDSELSSVRNNADLVVLSACNTSIGDIRRGEGVLSLARSFFKSGAKSVIPSLWSINDKAMTTITGDFYKNLSQGQTKSAALRNAKLTYLHSNTDAEASPHYWAPLILIGDNGVLLPISSYDWLWYLIVSVVLILVFIFVYRKRVGFK